MNIKTRTLRNTSKDWEDLRFSFCSQEKNKLVDISFSHPMNYFPFQNVLSGTKRFFLLSLAYNARSSLSVLLALKNLSFIIPCSDAQISKDAVSYQTGKQQPPCVDITWTEPLNKAAA